jgi:hypothetical protein
MAKFAGGRSVSVTDHVRKETENYNMVTCGKVLENSTRNRVKNSIKKVRVINPDASIPLYTNFDLKIGIERPNKLINVDHSINFTQVQTPLSEYS